MKVILCLTSCEGSNLFLFFCLFLSALESEFLVHYLLYCCAVVLCLHLFMFVIVLALTIITCCFFLAMGGSMGLVQQVPVVFIHGDSTVPGKLGTVGPGMPKGQALPLGASLVGAWYLTCLSSSSISWGAGLKGEL